MSICHDHNMTRPVQEKKFGFRLTLPPGDSLARLLGRDWQALHWYASEFDRDAALERIRSKHSYSRAGDFPTYVYTKIARD